jgi:GT2 family glycosyltransferase
MTILAIIVIFNCKIEESKTVISLLQAYKNSPEVFTSVKLIIYDNSLNEQNIFLDIPFEYQYVHNPNNVGLAIAYNYALRAAIVGNCDWLLLLDQDSYLPKNFIYNLTNIPSNIEKDNTVLAIVPKIYYNNRFLSPTKVLYGGIYRTIDIKHKGICNFHVTTIGSGVLLRTSFLQKIGGFNELYWLDCLDRWLFNTIHSLGKKVYVTDSIIDHNLSIMNYDKFMTEQRYYNILKSETMFMKSFKSKGENYVYLLRLLKRTLFLLVTVKNKKYSRMTFNHFISLFLSSKKRTKNA